VAGWEARIAEVGHHVNCIPDCGLLKSGALHRATPAAVPCSSTPRPQTGSNKPATAGQVRLATGGHHLWGLPAATASEPSLGISGCTNPLRENLRPLPTPRLNKTVYVRSRECREEPRRFRDSDVDRSTICDILEIPASL